MPFKLPFTPEAALDILREAQKLALEMKSGVTVEVKSDQTLVTQADNAVEKFLREKLAQLASGYSFLGEEGGLHGDPDVPSWVIDPIDGTTNYAKDIPLWCISIGLVANDEVVFGMIAVPEIGEILWAAQGQGAYRIYDGKTVRLNVADRLPLQQEDLIVCNTTVERVLDFSFVPCRLRNFGALAYHLTVLGRGSAVAIIAHYHKIYDVAAGLCICFEAGCVARYHDGSSWKAIVGGQTEKHPLFCAPPAVMGELLNIITPKLLPETEADTRIDRKLAAD
jgi:myo-inositol-1(or 4)-monophosphatase